MEHVNVISKRPTCFANIHSVFSEEKFWVHQIDDCVWWMIEKLTVLIRKVKWRWRLWSTQRAWTGTVCTFETNAKVSTAVCSNWWARISGWDFYCWKEYSCGWLESEINRFLPSDRMWLSFWERWLQPMVAKRKCQPRAMFDWKSNRCNHAIC